MDTSWMIETTRQAWSAIPAPPRAVVEPIFASWDEEMVREFVGVAPVNVDVTSAGFLGCAPLRELPPPAAAAYLGTYILGLLDGIDFQEHCGLYDDLITRPHVLACLLNNFFWSKAIRPYLPVECLLALTDLAHFLDERRSLLDWTSDEAARLIGLANNQIGV